MRYFLLASMALLVFSSCGHDSVTAPDTSSSCADISGSWDVTYTGQCPTDTYLQRWDFVQKGCAATLKDSNPDLPSVTVTLSGSSVHLQMHNGFINCTYSLEGDGTVEHNTIRGVVSGPVTGPCCAARTETLQFVATRRITAG